MHINFSQFDPLRLPGPNLWILKKSDGKIVCRLCQEKLPSRGLTYPTLGKGKSSSKCHFWGICKFPGGYTPCKLNVSPLKIYHPPQRKGSSSFPIVFSGANSLLNFRGCTTWKNSEFEPKKMEVFLLPGISAGDLILGAVTPLKINILHIIIEVCFRWFSFSNGWFWGSKSRWYFQGCTAWKIDGDCQSHVLVSHRPLLSQLLRVAIAIHFHYGAPDGFKLPRKYDRKIQNV